MYPQNKSPKPPVKSTRLVVKKQPAGVVFPKLSIPVNDFEKTVTLTRAQKKEAKLLKKAQRKANKLNNKQDSTFFNSASGETNNTILPPGVKNQADNKTNRFSKFISFFTSSKNKQPDEITERLVDDPTVKNRFSAFNKKLIWVLKDKKLRARAWKIVGYTNLVIVAFFAGLLAVMNKFITLSSVEYPAIALQLPINNALWGISIFVISIVTLPFWTMFILFLMGVKDVRTSRSIHYFIWIVLIINVVLLLVSCLLMIAAYAHLDGYNIWRNLESLNPNN
ncbi:hypothetical protein V4Q74_00270 [Mycoplasmoides genitalium]|uniref:MPN157 family protein n=1 Tax=Mycoplasmoides genitalium TaxID=2097 RepID=UPI002FCE569C